MSLLPQLEDANATRIRPAVTTHNQDNLGVRSEGLRFIQYADRAREFYDMRKDPNELRNLAKEQKFKKVIEEHLQFVPQFNRSPAKRKPEWDLNRGERSSDLSGVKGLP